MRVDRVVVAALLGAALAAAAEDDRTLRVGVAHFPPNVIVSEGEEPRGFDIDLWREISRLARIETSFEAMPFERLLARVGAGEVDAGLAGVTITAEREARLDFSHAYMPSGLRILTRVDEESPLARLIRSAWDSGAVNALGFLVALLILSAHVLYFAERGGGAIDARYFPGVLEAAWCALATMTTVGYGDIAPKKWLGRAAALLVMLTGIGAFGVVIAELSAGLTLARMTGRINGPDDLADLATATVAGSTAVEEARRRGARVVTTTVIEEAYELLEQGEVAAVLYDDPVLREYVNGNPDKPVVLVGPLLNPQSYGIAFPTDSPWREPVNRALLELRESGAYDEIWARWFGEN